MPRRQTRSSFPQAVQSTSRSTVKNRNAKRKARSQNAFAIASAENPDHVKVRQHRLGESELDADEPRQKRQRMLDEESDEEDGPPPSRAQMLKHKTVNKGERGPGGFDEEGPSSGSDGEGHHWRVGPGSEDDGDESVDSDEAFGESDEERFEDYAFRGSKQNQARRSQKPQLKHRSVDKQQQRTPREIDLGSESEAYESGDSLGSEAIDLATALDQYEEDEAGHQTGSKKETRSKPSTTQSTQRDFTDVVDGNEKFAKDTRHDLDVSSDEKGKEELSFEEFTSEDEGGSDSPFAAGTDRYQTLEDAESHKIMARTLGDTIDESSDDASSLGVVDASESDRESDMNDVPAEVQDTKTVRSIADTFAATDEMESSAADGQERSPHELLRAMEDLYRQEKGLPPLVKKEKQKSKLLKPLLPPRQQGKLDRGAAYREAKRTLDRWQETVKRNRRAEHLHFPIVDPDEQGAKGEYRILPPNDKQPRNELESAIDSILTQSGLQKPQRLSRDQHDEEPEGDHLPDQRKPTLKEEKARRAEMRKARELIFREEQRAKRIKKIKSKAYRRIHRKERERDDQRERDLLAAEGLEMSDEEREKQDRRRAEERMGGRHKNNRWAKGMKSQNRMAWDDEARSGVEEMARHDEILRAKTANEIGDREGDVSSDLGDDFDKADDETQQFRLREVLDDLEKSREEEPKSGLAALKFMKKIDEEERKRNEESIQRLRKELDGEDEGRESSPEANTGRHIFGPNALNKAAQKPIVERSEFEEPESDDEADNIHYNAEQQESNSSVAKTQRLTASSKPKAQLPKILQPVKVAGIGPISASSSETLQASPTFESAQGSPQKLESSVDSKSLDSSEKGRLKTSKAPKTSKEVFNKLLARSDATHAPSNSSSWPTVPYTAPDEPESAQPSLKANNIDQDAAEDAAVSLNPTNESLVRAAFGVDSTASTSFAAEKRAAETSEDESYAPNALPGWGTWTGAGLSRRSRAVADSRRRQSVKKTRDGVNKEKRKDKELKNVIVSEKKVHKNGKYMADSLPWPYENASQYNASMRVPLGPEWTTKESFQRATKPKVMVKQGVIKPMRKPIA